MKRYTRKRAVKETEMVEDKKKVDFQEKIRQKKSQLNLEYNETQKYKDLRQEDNEKKDPYLKVQFFFI